MTTYQKMSSSGEESEPQPGPDWGGHVTCTALTGQSVFTQGWAALADQVNNPTLTYVTRAPPGGEPKPSCT